MRESTKPIMAIVVPCFNEEAVLGETSARLLEKRQQLVDREIVSKESFVLFVDDGSGDTTWDLIKKYHAENPPACEGIKLAGNRGHQNALLCGLLAVNGRADAAISIDADLQDDIDIIDEMIEKYRDGHEIVYGVRSDRKTDSFFKRTSAQGFYRIMRLLGVDVVYNHADFRLMGKNALAALSGYAEVNLFLRGIIPLLGYKTAAVYYRRKERTAGVSKYPLRKMLQFAFEGITSFSIKPIRFITVLGVLLFAVSISMIIYFLARYWGGRTVAGWATIACSLWGIGGLILFSIGIIGEYIGKIYLEVKRRPRFHIEQSLTAKENVNEKY